MFPITAALVAAIAVASSAQAAVHSLQTPGGQCLTGSTSAGSTPSFANCNVQNNQRSPTTQQQWIIAPGNNVGVQLFGTELCLEAGANPEAGRTVTLTQCSDSASQTWYLTDDNRIAITGGTQCLEAQDASATTQECAPGIANQAWIPVFLFDENSSTSSGAGGVVGGAAGSATSVAGSATSAASSAVSGGLAGVTSSLSSAASAVTNGASSAVSSGASAAASGASAASSSVASGASVASSAVSAASSSAAGAVASASSAVSSASGALSSASGPLAGVASSLSSAASAASAAPTGGAVVNAIGMPAVFGAFLAAVLI